MHRTAAGSWGGERGDSGDSGRGGLDAIAMASARASECPPAQARSTAARQLLCRPSVRRRAPRPPSARGSRPVAQARHVQRAPSAACAGQERRPGALARSAGRQRGLSRGAGSPPARGGRRRAPHAPHRVPGRSARSSSRTAVRGALPTRGCARPGRRGRVARRAHHQPVGEHRLVYCGPRRAEMLSTVGSHVSVRRVGCRRRRVGGRTDWR